MGSRTDRKDDVDGRPAPRVRARPSLGGAVWLAAVPGALLFAWLQVSGYVRADLLGVDSHAYWLAARDLRLAYDVPVSVRDAFLYSPAFAQVLWPAAQLPWGAFAVGWFVAQLLAAAWLVRPLPWWQGAVLVLFVAGELVLGNVYLFLAVLLVLAVGGRGAALAPMALTKVTHAVVGLWYLLTGRWRQLLTAVLATGAVVALSVTADPGAWAAWLELLVGSSSSPRGAGLPVRLVLAVLLVVLAARLDRTVLLAPAMVLATPVLDGLTYLALLLAVPRLLARDRGVRAGAATAPGVEPGPDGSGRAAPVW